MKTFTVSKNINLRDFTDVTYPQGAFYFSALLRAKDIKVNGVRIGKNVNLNAGDEVVYYTSQKQESAKSHGVVYEDDNVFVADKLSGVTSEGLLSELNSRGKYFAVHRLDRNTQGVMIFAKTLPAEEELLTAFKEHAAEKTYIALCKNRFKNYNETMSAYLVKDEKNSVVKVYGRKVNGGVKIITEYKVLEAAGEIALVEIKLHTGKTHQIRAHFAFIGCPVLGDEKYGDGELNEKYKLKRQCLIAKRLQLTLNGELAYLNKKIFESELELPELI